MLATIFAHVSSLVGGWIASWLVGLTFGLLNVGIAFVVVGVATSVLIRVGATPERLEAVIAQFTNAMQFVTGQVEGFAKILLSLLIFSLFKRQPGLVMIFLFIGFQFVPTPAFIPNTQRKNMRAGAIGTVSGLLTAWWLYYPKA
jgi:hypothetical protein